MAMTARRALRLGVVLASPEEGSIESKELSSLADAPNEFFATLVQKCADGFECTFVTCSGGLDWLKGQLVWTPVDDGSGHKVTANVFVIRMKAWDKDRVKVFGRKCAGEIVR